MSSGNIEMETEGMKRQAQFLIDRAYQKGYKSGMDDADVTMFSQKSKLIEQGRDEVWEAVKKLYLSEDFGGLNGRELDKIFDVTCLSDILEKFSASEVIEKLRAYEKKKQKEDSEIHVGDEVAFPSGNKFIVVRLSEDNDTFEGLYADGTGVDMELVTSRVTKTGRHFPKLVDLLKTLKEEK